MSKTSIHTIIARCLYGRAFFTPYLRPISSLKPARIKKVNISLDFINYIGMMPRILNNECNACYE